MRAVLQKARRLLDRRLPSLPEGQRIYAIGDIHGCHGELVRLLAIIDADDQIRGLADTLVIVLGDFVDRGPDTAQVIAYLVEEKRRRGSGFRVLSGNHEELLLRSIRGDVKALRMLHSVGGKATFVSYGLSPSVYDEMEFDELVKSIADLLPASHVAFLDGLESLVCAGDYVFAHAGIRPGVPLDQQSQTDVRWIREPFLSARRNDGLVVVHGHNTLPTIDVSAGRIGVDTGAYATGILTAVGLEGSERWFLQAAPAATVTE